MSTENVVIRKDFESYTPRERILAAALKLFVEQGYFNTNVPDLSRESKCSVGSIYHCFKNKEEVARYLYIEGIKSFRNALEQSVKEVDPSDIETLVKRIVTTFMSFSEINKQMSKYIWLCRHNEFMTGIIKNPTSIGYDKLGRKLAKGIKLAIKEEKITANNATVIWSIIFGIPLSYIRDWLEGFNKQSPNEVSERIAEACWKALNAK